MDGMGVQHRAGLARKKTGLSVACKRYLLILRDDRSMLRIIGASSSTWVKLSGLIDPFERMMCA